MSSGGGFIKIWELGLGQMCILVSIFFFSFLGFVSGNRFGVGVGSNFRGG